MTEAWAERGAEMTVEGGGDRGSLLFEKIRKVELSSSLSLSDGG